MARLVYEGAAGDVGPVVARAACARIREWMDRGVSERATLAVDGRGAEGAFVGPTILDDVASDMAVAHEEIFGPVLSVSRVDTPDGAIAVVKRSRFGNGRSIFTQNGAAVRRHRHEGDGDVALLLQRPGERNLLRREVTVGRRQACAV